MEFIDINGVLVLVPADVVGIGRDAVAAWVAAQVASRPAEPAPHE